MQDQYEAGRMFETLERRVLLSVNGYEHELFYPEGYAHAGISESVLIANIGETEANYELLARYEVGERDEVIASGSIDGLGQDEITISEAGFLEGMRVRSDTPYSLVLQSDAPLSATFRHDDFGGSTAEAFTSETATLWAFGSAAKQGQLVHDFVVFYNPNDAAVNVELFGVNSTGRVFRLQQTVDGFRRGGWNLNDAPGVPNGEFGLIVRASAPIGVAMSHYEDDGDSAYGEMGEMGGGALAGMVFDVEFEGRERQGGPEFTQTVLTILNATEDLAIVRLFFMTRDGDPPANNDHTVEIDGGAREEYTLADFGLEDATDLALVYSSDIEVTVSGVVEREDKMFHVDGTPTAATEWTYTNPILNQIRNGQVRSDDLFVFNPGEETAELTIEFFYANGDAYEETLTLEHLDVTTIDISAFPPSDGSGRPVFGVRVISSSTIVSGLQYWTRGEREAFSLDRIIDGIIVDLADVLVF